MLVLNRKRGEAVRIDNNTVVTVVEIKGNRVKLGFTADRRCPIVREEIAGKGTDGKEQE